MTYHFDLGAADKKEEYYGEVVAERHGDRTKIHIDAKLGKTTRPLSLYLVEPLSGIVREEFKLDAKSGVVDKAVQTSLDRFRVIVSPEPKLKVIRSSKEVALTAASPHD